MLLSNNQQWQLPFTPSSSSFCLSSRNSGASQPSLCCETKVVVGFRPQSSSSAGGQISLNLSAQFYDEVHKRVQTACKGNKPIRGRARMMPIETPRVPYKTPGESTRQWVDFLWLPVVIAIACFCTLASAC